LILRKITKFVVTKFVATRCQILRLKCTKFNTYNLHSAPPEPLAGFKGATSKGRAEEWGKGKGSGRERGNGKGGRRREGAPIEMKSPYPKS